MDAGFALANKREAFVWGRKICAARSRAATRPLSAVLIAAAAWLLVLSVLPKLRRKRDEVFVEG